MSQDDTKHQALLSRSPGYRQFVAADPDDDLYLIKAFADWLLAGEPDPFADDADEWDDWTMERFRQEWDRWNS